MSDRLRQLEMVGRGAMAEVFRGVLVGERGTRRDVAIKRLRPDLRDDPAAVELFVGEAQIAVRLSHPNVVHALELTRDDTGYALVCEWLDCSALAELHQRCGDLPVESVLHVGRSLCGALDYVHGLNGDAAPVVHRDVTPGNVFVTASGEVKLGDFGVAWCPSPGSLVDVRSAGTPGFAAPEQSDGTAIDARSDVYGIGKTLASLNSALPPELQSPIDRACAADPSERFASAADFDAALVEAAGSLGVRVGPEALRTWLSAHGGLPERVAPPSLDGAVQSLLGSAIDTNGGTDERPALATASAPAPARRATAAVVAFFFAVAGVALWWSIDFGANDTATATPNNATGLTVETPTTAVAQPSEPGEPTAEASPPPLGVHVPPPSVPAKEPRRPDPRRKLTPASAARATLEAPPPARGRVVLNAVPWAEVHINGRKIGNTPIRHLELPAGKHRVRLVHPPQKLEREVTLQVDADRTQTFVINLRRGSVDRRVSP